MSELKIRDRTDSSTVKDSLPMSGLGQLSPVRWCFHEHLVGAVATGTVRFHAQGSLFTTKLLFTEDVTFTSFNNG